MIKLGDVVEVEYGKNIKKMWLVKDLDLKRNGYGGYYKALGFQQGSGWWSLNNGTLREMREFIEQYRIDNKLLVEFAKEV